MSALARLSLDVQERVPLGNHTSLRVGGPARHFLASSDAGPIARLLGAAVADGHSVLVLGGGSNLLVADAGFDGVVVKYTASGYRVETEPNGNLVVRVAAGTSYSNLARRLAREGLAGLEWAANVPGTVGGAIVNNAGAFGGSTAEHVIDVELARAGGAVETLTGHELGYAYRTSILKRGELGPVLVTSARLRVRRDDPQAALARIQELQARRTASQPRQLSAGSIFANPPDDFAGRLVELVGLKGARRGGAEISGQHANFIVNTGGATARDVLSLIRLAQYAVWSARGVWLHPEVQLVGAWDAEEIAGLAGPNGRASHGGQAPQEGPASQAAHDPVNPERAHHAAERAETDGQAAE